MQNDERILRSLRAMAWERAKGELMAVLETFHGTDGAREGQFHEASKAVMQFIEHVHENGLFE